MFKKIENVLQTHLGIKHNFPESKIFLTISFVCTSESILRYTDTLLLLMYSG